MILVDPRSGSRELLPILRRRYRLPATYSEMEFGDVVFAGRGRHGHITIAIEVKKLSDMLDCKKDGRLAAHQLPGLHRDYEGGDVWGLLVGEYSVSREGLITVRRGHSWQIQRHREMWCEFEAWLLTLQIKGGMRLARAKNVYDACRWIGALYHWYQKKWEAHHSLNVFFEPPPDDRRLLIHKHSLVRRWAKELDGMEWTLSGRVEERFPSAEAMVAATIPDWQSIEGIGKAKAQSAWNQIRAANPRCIPNDPGGKDGDGGEDGRRPVRRGANRGDAGVRRQDRKRGRPAKPQAGRRVGRLDPRRHRR